MKMKWNELIDVTKLGEVRITLIKPIRNGEEYKSGKMTGYKSGIFGGGWNTKHDSFNSTKMRWIKKIKVQITYDHYIFWGQSKKQGQEQDWVDIDNCEFELIQLEADKSIPDDKIKLK